MKASRLAKIIPILIRPISKSKIELYADDDTPASRAIMIWGESGIGKSSIIYQCAMKMADVLHRDSFMSTMNARELRSIDKVVLTSAPQLCIEDLMGFPVQYKNEENIDDVKFHRALKLIPNPIVPNGLWIIDEPNRANKEVRNALMQVALEGFYMDYALPAGWCIACTCNPPGADYQVDELDSALIARFIHFNMEVDDIDLIDWGVKSGKITTRLLEHLGRHPELLHKPKDANIAIQPPYLPPLTPNPRSLEMLSRIIMVMSQEEIKEYLFDIASGLDGASHAKNISDTYTNIDVFEKLPPIHILISDYLSYRSIVKNLIEPTPNFIRVDIARLIGIKMLSFMTNNQICLKNKKGHATPIDDALYYFAEDAPADITIALMNEMNSCPSLQETVLESDKTETIYKRFHSCQ